MWLRIATVAFALGWGLAAPDAAAISKQQADSLDRKIESIQRYGSAESKSGVRKTPVSEAELNSWFAYHAPPLLPPGVTEPRVTILDNRTVIGTIVVSLDAIAKSRASGRSLDVWNLVGGQVPVTVIGVLHARDRRVRFELQSADVSGIPVPPRVVQELVDFYSRSAERPAGVQLDGEYALPAGIREIELNRGSAVVIQ